MKSALLMLALVFSFTSCTQKAPETSPEDTKPGDERSTNPIVVEQDSELKLNILNVCAALEEKENVLSDYVGEALQVTVQESDCSGKLGKPVNHEVSVIRDGGMYIFQNASRNFPSPEVETLKTGVMKEICANIVGLKNPLIPAGSQTAFEFLQVNTSFCRTDSQNVCLQVMKGRISADSTTYKASEITLISFRTARGERTGFYNYKNVKNFSTCGEGQYRTKLLTFN